jgi:hypothetical protein
MGKVLLVKGAAALALAIWLPSAAAAQAEAEVRARGSWQVSKPSRDSSASIAAREGDAERIWTARPRVSPSKQITGPVSIELGTETISAELRGRMDGGRVWGDVIGAGGEQLGTFAGTYGPGGWRGTFTSATDDQGTWEWDGLPAAE